MISLKTNSLSIVFLTVFCCVFAASSSATKLHVSKAGNDQNSSTSAQPFPSISKAAEIAQARDIITVHKGTYREWVNPAHGGSSEDKRIVYQVAMGENIFIKGSERDTSWTDLVDGAEQAKNRLPQTSYANKMYDYVK